MPLTRIVADALGVVTICLISILGLLGFLCISYLLYFRTRISSQGFARLGYFNGPWIIRITFIIFAIWWGFGEIIRLHFLRREGRLLNALTFRWQDNICKCYIVSNLGFAEPCLFLSLAFLLRGSLQKTELGALSPKWNCKTAGYILLFCLPVFVLQLVTVLIGRRVNNEAEGYMRQLPRYFTRTAVASKSNDDIALCAYPLLSTIFLGLFATVASTYLFWLGKRILNLVINKGLKNRVSTLIFIVSIFFPLRILFLGLSVLSRPGNYLFEIVSFLAFLSFLCCAGVGVWMLVYFPVADSLGLRNLQGIEEARRVSDEHDSISLIANQSPLEDCTETEMDSKRGSISFRGLEKEESTSGAFVELSLFSHSQNSSPPGSPRPLGWPMLSPAQQAQSPSK